MRWSRSMLGSERAVECSRRDGRLALALRVQGACAEEFRIESFGRQEGVPARRVDQHEEWKELPDREKLRGPGVRAGRAARDQVVVPGSDRVEGSARSFDDLVDPDAQTVSSEYEAFSRE